MNSSTIDMNQVNVSIIHQDVENGAQDDNSVPLPIDELAMAAGDNIFT